MGRPFASLNLMSGWLRQIEGGVIGRRLPRVGARTAVAAFLGIRRRRGSGGRSQQQTASQSIRGVDVGVQPSPAGNARNRISCRSVSPRAISQAHGHPSVSTFRRARWAIRSGDFVHRLSGHFGGLGARQHPNGDAGGCEIGEGYRASARRRGAGGASRRAIRRGYSDRHRSLTRRTGHFDDQARTADQRASTRSDDAAP